MPLNRWQDQSAQLATILQSAKETQAGSVWPAAYKSFFGSWGYFNAIYATLYPNKQEWKQIAFFALEPAFAACWPKIALDTSIQELANLPCVGNSSKNNAIPEEYVKTATYILRDHFNLNSTSICTNHPCDSRGRPCTQFQYSPPAVSTTDPRYARHTPLGATLTIIYQIRNNLFHGRKTEMNKKAGKRNITLVSLADSITRTILQETTPALAALLQSAAPNPAQPGAV